LNEVLKENNIKIEDIYEKSLIKKISKKNSKEFLLIYVKNLKRIYSKYSNI